MGHGMGLVWEGGCLSWCAYVQSWLFESGMEYQKERGALFGSDVQKSEEGDRVCQVLHE